MKVRVTLNINPEVVRKAKIYAKNHNISLSKLVENYLKSIVSAKK